MPRLSFSTPALGPVLTAKYQQFRGADFSTDPVSVSASRSPAPRNLIADAGGYPEKRPGWQSVLVFGNTPRINGLYCFVPDSGDTQYLVHVGIHLYRWYPKLFFGESAPAPVHLLSELGNVRSTAVQLSVQLAGEAQPHARLWLLAGGRYLCYDGDSVQEVSSLAYVPTLSISRTPAGVGVAYEAANLLTPWRIDAFLADGTSTAYFLSATGLDDAAPTVVANGVELTQGVDYSVEPAAGVIRFTSPPAAPAIPGEDNVFIRYAKTASPGAAAITNCSILAKFGAATGDRVFFSGNPAYKNRDWHSAHRDPSYVPADSYALIGDDETAILGYLPMGERQLILKEARGQEATVYLRSCETLPNGETAFPVRQGVQSVGAVSPHCIHNVLDDPLFLSASGVFAVTTANLTLERTVRRRSAFIDPRLCTEENLSEAVGVLWGDWYLIAVNGRCYVADASRKTYEERLSDSFLYEWYYWDNIPARCFLTAEGRLFFGTGDGRVCVFKAEGDPGLSPLASYSDDGAPIVAEWATKADDDGDFMRWKSLLRRGCGVLAKPYTRSNIQVLLRTEIDVDIAAVSAPINVFDFTNLDFTALSFNTSEAPQAVPLNTRLRRYRTLQIILKNDKLNQGFGVLGILKRCRMGAYVR